MQRSSGSLALSKLVSINLAGATLPTASPGIGNVFKSKHHLLDTTLKQTGSLDHLNQRHIRTSGEFLFLQFWRAILRFYQVLSQLSSRTNFIKSSYTAAGKTGRNFFSLSSISLFPSDELSISDQTEYMLPISNNQMHVFKAYGYFNMTHSNDNDFNSNAYQYQSFQNTISGEFVVRPRLPLVSRRNDSVENGGGNKTTLYDNKITGSYLNNFGRETLNIVINRNDLNSILPYTPYFYNQKSLSTCAQFPSAPPPRWDGKQNARNPAYIRDHKIPAGRNKIHDRQNSYLKSTPTIFYRNAPLSARKASNLVLANDPVENPRKIVWPSHEYFRARSFPKTKSFWGNFLPARNSKKNPSGKLGKHFAWAGSSTFHGVMGSKMVGVETIIKKLLYETKELRVFDAKERMRNVETKLFNGVFKEFFNLDPLSQDLDETNGLSEIIHKRRISALGKGGVTSKNAPLSIRSIHPSFYGRLCPIDSPEGDRVGLINSLTNYARINSTGYIATPFYRTRQHDYLEPRKGGVNPLLGVKSTLQMRICVPIAFFGKIHSLGSLNPRLLPRDNIFPSLRFSFPDIMTHFSKIKESLKWKIPPGVRPNTSPQGGINLQIGSTGVYTYNDTRQASLVSLHAKRWGGRWWGTPPIGYQNYKQTRVLDCTRPGGYSSPISAYFRPAGIGDEGQKYPPGKDLSQYPALAGSLWPEISLYGTKPIYGNPFIYSSKQNPFRSTKIHDFRRSLEPMPSFGLTKTQQRGFAYSDFRAFPMFLNGTVPHNYSYTNWSSITNKTSHTPYRKLELFVFYDTHYMTPPITHRETPAGRNNAKPPAGKGVWNNTSVSTPFLTCYFDFISFQGYAPITAFQFFSPGVGLIPFLEHDDGTRALMGANMQRQAVPLISASRPIVGTGLEKNVAASFIISSSDSGYLYYISGKQSKQIFSQKTQASRVKSEYTTTLGRSKIFEFLARHPEGSSKTGPPPPSGWGHCLVNFGLAYLSGHCFSKIQKAKSIRIAEKTNPLKKIFGSALTGGNDRGILNLFSDGVPISKIVHKQAFTSFSVFASYKTKTQTPFKPSKSRIKQSKAWHDKAWPDKATNIKYSGPPLHPRGGYFKNGHVFILNTHWLPYRKSYKATIINKKPAITENSWLQKGDLLVDGTSSINGELALGRNLFSIYMPWEGYNFEDAILISDKAAQSYTTIHVEEFSVKISKNEFVSAVVKPFTWVNLGDILVSKKRKLENEFIMNRLLFGMSSKPKIKNSPPISALREEAPLLNQRSLPRDNDSFYDTPLRVGSLPRSNYNFYGDKPKSRQAPNVSLHAKLWGGGECLTNSRFKNNNRFSRLNQYRLVLFRRARGGGPEAYLNTAPARSLKQWLKPPLKRNEGVWNKKRILTPEEENKALFVSDACWPVTRQPSFSLKTRKLSSSKVEMFSNSYFSLPVPKASPFPDSSRSASPPTKVRPAGTDPGEIKTLNTKAHPFLPDPLVGKQNGGDLEKTWPNAREARTASRAFGAPPLKSGTEGVRKTDSGSKSSTLYEAMGWEMMGESNFLNQTERFGVYNTSHLLFSSNNKTDSVKGKIPPSGWDHFSNDEKKNSFRPAGVAVLGFSDPSPHPEGGLFLAKSGFQVLPRLQKSALRMGIRGQKNVGGGGGDDYYLQKTSELSSPFYKVTISGETSSIIKQDFITDYQVNRDTITTPNVPNQNASLSVKRLETDDKQSSLLRMNQKDSALRVFGASSSTGSALKKNDNFEIDTSYRTGESICGWVISVKSQSQPLLARQNDPFQDSAKDPLIRDHSKNRSAVRSENTLVVPKSVDHKMDQKQESSQINHENINTRNTESIMLPSLKPLLGIYTGSIRKFLSLLSIFPKNIRVFGPTSRGEFENNVFHENNIKKPTPLRGNKRLNHQKNQKRIFQSPFEPLKTVTSRAENASIGRPRIRRILGPPPPTKVRPAGTDPGADFCRTRLQKSALRGRIRRKMLVEKWNGGVRKKTPSGWSHLPTSGFPCRFTLGEAMGRKMMGGGVRKTELTQTFNIPLQTKQWAGSPLKTVPLLGTEKSNGLPNKTNTEGQRPGADTIYIYVAVAKPLQVGDKMSGRHGNKGIISKILPFYDMPYLIDGTPIDIVLNPLGVPSRMNVGQIYESLLGLTGFYKQEYYRIPPFDENYSFQFSRNFVYWKLNELKNLHFFTSISPYYPKISNNITTNSVTNMTPRTPKMSIQTNANLHIPNMKPPFFHVPSLQRPLITPGFSKNSCFFKKHCLFNYQSPKRRGGPDLKSKIGGSLNTGLPINWNTSLLWSPKSKILLPPNHFLQSKSFNITYNNGINFLRSTSKENWFFDFKSVQSKRWLLSKPKIPAGTDLTFDTQKHHSDQLFINQNRPAVEKFGLNPYFPGKMRLLNGLTGETFYRPIIVGKSYMLKLIHLVHHKIHARATGPYALITQQPLKGKRNQGGQRMGEMEIWALYGFGSASILYEMLTIKSDDPVGRERILREIAGLKGNSSSNSHGKVHENTNPLSLRESTMFWKNEESGLRSTVNDSLEKGISESFRVLVMNLRALCLDMQVFKDLPN